MNKLKSSRSWTLCWNKRLLDTKVLVTNPLYYHSWKMREAIKTYKREGKKFNNNDDSVKIPKIRGQCFWHWRRTSHKTGLLELDNFHSIFNIHCNISLRFVTGDAMGKTFENFKDVSMKRLTLEDCTAVRRLFPQLSPPPL